MAWQYRPLSVDAATHSLTLSHFPYHYTTVNERTVIVWWRGGFLLLLTASQVCYSNNTETVWAWDRRFWSTDHNHHMLYMLSSYCPKAYIAHKRKQSQFTRVVHLPDNLKIWINPKNNLNVSYWYWVSDRMPTTLTGLHNANYTGSTVEVLSRTIPRSANISKE